MVTGLGISQLLTKIGPFALLTVVSSVAVAEETVGLRPFGECRSGYWSSTRNLDDVKDLSSSTCLLNVKLQAAPNLRFAANGRFSQGVSATTSFFRARVREGYLQTDFGDLSVKLGRQIVAWGRSDRISPTDVFSSRDFTARVPDDDEQRNGNDLALLRWQATKETSLTALVGRFEPHTVPTGALPVNLTTLARPDRAEYGLKLDRVGSGVDLSVSYFDGFDKTARYNFVQNGQSSLRGNFQSRHERMRMIGVDFATSTGRWTLRGEAAHFRMTTECSSCLVSSNGVLSARNIQRAVIGVDRDLFDTANVNLQLFGIRRSSYFDAQSVQGTSKLVAEGLDRLNSEFGAIERGATLRVSERFLSDALKAEVSSFIDFNNSSRLIRTRMSYSVNDQFKVYLGVDRFQGAAQSYFGARKKNNVSYVELAWVF